MRTEIDVQDSYKDRGQASAAAGAQEKRPQERAGGRSEGGDRRGKQSIYQSKQGKKEGLKVS
jgi:hypothetical protein